MPPGSWIRSPGEGVYAALRSAEVAAEVAGRATPGRRRVRARPPARPPARGRGVRGEDACHAAAPASDRPARPARWWPPGCLARRPAQLAGLMGVFGDFVPPARAARAAVPRRPPAAPPPPPGEGDRDSLSFCPSWTRAAGSSRWPERPTPAPLAEGALWIAAEAYPELDVPHWLGRLEVLGRRAAERVTPDMAGGRRRRRLSRLLFEEEGFRGNTDDYYDPRNSFLNDVLDRRLGIPISLSVVYLAVAARVGLDAARRRAPRPLRRARRATRAPPAARPLPRGPAPRPGRMRGARRGVRPGAGPLDPRWLRPCRRARSWSGCSPT